MPTAQSILLRCLPLFARAGIAATVLGCSDDPSHGADQGGSISAVDASVSGAGSSGGSDAGAMSMGVGTSDAGNTSTDAALPGAGTADSSTGDGGALDGMAASGDGGNVIAADGGSPEGGTSFALMSPNHMDGAKFAPRYTCAEKGFNGSILPELNWTEGPVGTKSYALTFIDRTLADRGMANGYHWAIWNIPTTVMKLTEGMTDAATVMARQTGAFLGPCPNFVGSGKTDNYEFTLYAMKTETINLTGGGQATAQTQNAEKAFEMDNLAKVKLKGSSDAKPPM